MRRPGARPQDGGHARAGRADARAAGARRLGSAHPRQEGPVDLRLVPPALAAWAAAALALDAPPRLVVGAVVVCVVVAGALLVTWTACGRPAAGTRGRLGRWRGGAWGRVSVAAVLLCAGAAAASAGLHGADLHRGPVPGLAREYATVTAELEVTSDPRRTRPRVTGDRPMPPAVVLNADVVRVTETDGTTTVTRTPVLVVVRQEEKEGGRDTGTEGPQGAPEARAEARGAGQRRDSPWLGLLPSTRLRVRADLVPPLPDSGGIAAVLRVPGDRGPRVTGEPSGAQRFAGGLRGGLREATDGLPADARALLPGLVIGDTSRVPPELEQAFRATDLTHVLAVSGANLTIVLALLIGPPGTAHRAERRGLAPRLGIPLRTTALLGGALTLGFVLVCRPEPSVVRAAACGLVVLLALATGRRRSLIPALAAVVLVLVLYDPWLSRSYGFLLSVLATGALLTLAPRWSAGLRRHGVPGRLAEALAAAAAAQAVCAPVVAVLAARVSLVAVPCNLLAEFAVAPATVLGFAALAVAPVAMPVAKVLAWGASWPTEWIAGIARTGASLPGNGVDWPGSWRGALLLAAVTVVLVLVGRRLVRHPWVCAACALLLLAVVVQPPPLTRVIAGWPPPRWRLVMCDVGQGDATVLAAGPGAGVVVDAGPDPMLVDRCLRSLGITRVPLVLLTHFHADHVAGLPGVLRGRSVGAIQTTGFGEPPGQVAFVRAQAAARGVPVTRAEAGERRRTGELDWQVLWPAPRPASAPEGANDASVTLLVRTRGLTLLLLGDLEPPAQRALVRTPAGAALPRVDVLKVAHHGSAYQDPGLLRRAGPRLALISCGADNSYGHPSPRTVSALRGMGAMVVRTDVDGAIAVVGGRAGGGSRGRDGGAAGVAGGEGEAELGVVTRRP
ncbi:ComEC/Rec2 family competence protein [Streptomyces sp. AN091965]|uniref:ComEC/Rec2 family competence protein n=1 Tax=Streptomyces sp. AN091965 TaxID=2927803 RepID=UPI001F61BAFD|nr:ComEC/Rec2 family competence protein [Streptomyces sp. AN091965]MCI3930642.1 ComEC/Rec2 family competence protein [Streptomyces sp. AN091965]